MSNERRMAQQDRRTKETGAKHLAFNDRGDMFFWTHTERAVKDRRKPVAQNAAEQVLVTNATQCNGDIEARSPGAPVSAAPDALLPCRHNSLSLNPFTTHGTCQDCGKIVIIEEYPITTPAANERTGKEKTEQAVESIGIDGDQFDTEVPSRARAVNLAYNARSGRGKHITPKGVSLMAEYILSLEPGIVPVSAAPVPCPFCHEKFTSTGNGYFVVDKSGEWGRFECHVCTAQGPEVDTESKSVKYWRHKAIARWNKRTFTTFAAKPVDGLPASPSHEGVASLGVKAPDTF